MDTKDEYRQSNQGNLSQPFKLMAILQLEEHELIPLNLHYMQLPLFFSLKLWRASPQNYQKMSKI